MIVSDKVKRRQRRGQWELLFALVAALAWLPARGFSASPIPFRNISGVISISELEGNGASEAFLLALSASEGIPLSMFIDQAAFDDAPPEKANDPKKTEGPGQRVGRAASAAQLPVQGSPQWFPGMEKPLEEPKNGKTDAIRPTFSPTSQAIVRAATRATPTRPLVVIANGPLTALANALRTTPVGPRIVVFATAPDSGLDLMDSGDPWALAVAMEQCRFLIVREDIDSQSEILSAETLESRYTDRNPFFKTVIADHERAGGIPGSDLTLVKALIQSEVKSEVERFELESISEDGSIKTQENERGPIFVIKASELAPFAPKYFEALDAVKRASRESFRLLIDADTGGGLDDLFTIARCLNEPRFNIAGITSAHFPLAPGATVESARVSYHYTIELLKQMGRQTIAVGEGSSYPLSSVDQPIDSPAARLIIQQARRASPSTPLRIFALGPLTNPASAILIDPNIIPNIELYFHGGAAAGAAWTGNDPNSLADPVAFNYIAQHPRLKLTLVTPSATGQLQITRQEYRRAIQSAGPGWNWLDQYWTEYVTNRVQPTTYANGDTWTFSSAAAPLILLDPAWSSKRKIVDPNNPNRSIVMTTDIDEDALKKAFLNGIQ